MKNRTIIITALLLLLVIAGGFAYMKTSAVSTVGKQNSSIVEKISLDETIEVSGNITPLRTDKLSFNEQVRIIHIYVTEGQSVSKGQLLSELTSDEVLLKIEQKKYQIEQEKRSGSVRNAELMNMELDQLKAALNDRKMIAPFDGTIGKINYRVGDVFSSEKPLMSLINTDSLISIVDIDELDIPIAEVGQKVSFNFNALPGKLYEGYLSKLAPVGKLTEYGLAVREAELRIDNPAVELFSPYSFRAQIRISEPVETLVLDEKALIRENDAIYVNISGKLNKTEIQIKPYKMGKVIVLDGLFEGDEVLIPLPSLPTGSGFFGGEDE